MWLFPVLTWIALVAMTGIFVLMLRQPDTRDQLLATGVLTVVLRDRRRAAEAAEKRAGGRRRSPSETRRGPRVDGLGALSRSPVSRAPPASGPRSKG